MSSYFFLFPLLVVSACSSKKTGLLLEPAETTLDMAMAEQFPLPADFSMKLSAFEREHSKDSHTSAYKCAIFAGKIQLYGPFGKHGPRGQVEHTTLSFYLKERSPAELRRFLETLQRIKSFKEVKSLNGPGFSIELELSMVINGETREVKVDLASGRGGLSPAGQEVKENVEALMGMLMSFANIGGKSRGGHSNFDPTELF